MRKKRTYTPQQLAIIRRKAAEKQKSKRFTYGNHQYVDNYPHFRQYRVSGHPALIISLTKHNKTNEVVYAYRDVTHSGDGDSRHYEELNPNPNPEDKEPMRIHKRVRFDIPQNFSDRPIPWKYPKKERRKVKPSFE